MSDAKITLLLNGPHLVSGPIKLLKLDGTEMEVVEQLALCRCGASASKPFCDGSHKRVGFKSGAEAG